MATTVLLSLSVHSITVVGSSFNDVVGDSATHALQ
jgi:hypothetical protein